MAVLMGNKPAHLKKGAQQAVGEARLVLVARNPFAVGVPLLSFRALFFFARLLLGRYQEPKEPAVLNGKGNATQTRPSGVGWGYVAALSYPLSSLTPTR